MRYRPDLRWSFAGLLVLAGAAGAQPASPGSCTIDAEILERGQRRPFVICGDNIPANFRIDGPAAAGISIQYAQYLKRCSLEQRGPGLYIWLEAGPDATQAPLRVVDAGTGETACDGLEIDVPARLDFGDARVEPVPGQAGTFVVTVESGGRADLRGVCEAGVSFPPDPMAREVVLGQGPPGGVSLECTRGRVILHVVARGAERFPSRVILMDIDAGADGPETGVARLHFPLPSWESAMADDDAKFIDVNGYRTRYFDAGSGEDTVILLHGGQPDPISPTAQDWRGVFATLARHFRVIAYDNIGHGLTDPPATDADYENYYSLTPAHLAGLIDALGLSRVHLVGHSQGGWPVTRVALDRPEQVRCLVNAGSIMSLAGDAGRATTGRWAYSIFYVNPPEGPTPESLMRLALFDAYTWNHLSFETVDEQYRFARSPALIEAQARMANIRMSPGHPRFRSLREQALKEIAAGALPVPHLLIQGADDKAAPLTAGLDFMSLATAGGGRVNMHVITRAGHRFFQEYPEEFAAAVLGFCSPYRADHAGS